MPEKKDDQIEVPRCPQCGKPIGEGECQRCSNYRMAIKENGQVIVMM